MRLFRADDLTKLRDDVVVTWALPNGVSATAAIGEIRRLQDDFTKKKFDSLSEKLQSEMSKRAGAGVRHVRGVRGRGGRHERHRHA